MSQHRARLLHGIVEQPSFERVRRQRGGEQESLQHVAAKFLQHAALGVGLDALGDDGHFQDLANADHRGGDRQRTAEC